MDLLRFFDAPVDEVARGLVGALFGHGETLGRVVEVEAYDATDPASHSFAGETPRNRAMFLGPGHLYVYRSYGLHWCVNLVARRGAAVLIRALEPLDGLDLMAARRGGAPLLRLCAGPGNVTAALGISGQHDAEPLAPPFQLTLPETPQDVITGPRIGISKAADIPWRFGLRGSPFLSRPFPRARNA